MVKRMMTDDIIGSKCKYIKQIKMCYVQINFLKLVYQKKKIGDLLFFMNRNAWNIFKHQVKKKIKIN